MCCLIEYHLLPLAPVALVTYWARFGSAVDPQVIKAKLDHSFRCKYLSEQSVRSKSGIYLHSGDCVPKSCLANTPGISSHWRQIP